MEHFCRVEIGYLNQLQIAGAGGFEGAVEIFGVGVVHEHVEFEALMVRDEGAAHFDVAQMRADDDLAACVMVVYIGIQVVGVFHHEVWHGDFMLPHGKAVGHGLAEGRKLAVYGETRGQRCGGKTAFQVALILAHTAALGGGGEVEIGGNKGGNAVHRPQGQVAHQPFGNLEEEAVAALALCRPMRLLGGYRLRPSE